MNKAEKNGFKFNKKFQRIMVFVLAFFVLFSSFGSTLLSSAIPRELDEIDVVYEKFELIDKKDEKPLEGLLEYWTGFFLKIKWDASAYGDNLKEGDHFTVNIPDEIKLKTAQEFDLTFEGKVIGRAVITPGSEGGGTIKVTFNKNVEHVDKIKGDLKIDAMFNVKKYVKQENGDYKISFEFDGKHYEYDIEGVKLNQNEIFNKWSNTPPSGFDRVEWVLRINVKKATFSNTVITDELSVKTGELPDEIKYIPSSFKLRNVRYGINGAVEEIYKIFYYSEISSYITFDEKQQKFTFRLGDFLKSKGYNDISEKQWTLIYDSTYIEGMKLRNKANFTATETTVILETSFFNEHASGGISGETNNRIRIKKVDSENESVFLKGAVFKIKNISTGEIFTDTTDDDGIAEFEHLKPGQYTLEEVTPPPGGYMKDDTVYTLNVVNGELTYKKIKNTKNPKISKTVTKTWNDSDNQDGKRPDRIKVTLYANGEKVTEVEVTKENGWKHTFADLPKYKDGQEINYTVKETPVEGYQTAVNGMDITNSRTPDKISKTVTKTWNDSDNQDGKRPDRIKVTLYANGEKVTEVEVTKENGWKHTFADLPKYKDGQEINYTVKETPVEGYQTAVNGMDITNSRTPTKTNKNNTGNTPVIPKTGNYNNGRSDIIMGESAMLLSAGLIVLVLAQRRKKEETKD
ncbi:MAG: Cna B-type domain-containing protein [Candidatus Fimenecus sp.]